MNSNIRIAQKMKGETKIKWKNFMNRNKYNRNHKSNLKSINNIQFLCLTLQNKKNHSRIKIKINSNLN